MLDTEINAIEILQEFRKRLPKAIIMSTPNSKLDTNIFADYSTKEDYTATTDVDSFGFASRYSRIEAEANADFIKEDYKAHKGYLLNTHLCNRLYNYTYLDYVLDFIRYGDIQCLTKIKTIKEFNTSGNFTPLSAKFLVSELEFKYCKYKAKRITLTKYKEQLRKAYINYICISTLKDPDTYDYPENQIKKWVDHISVYYLTSLSEDTRAYLKLAGY